VSGSTYMSYGVSRREYGSDSLSASRHFSGQGKSTIIQLIENFYHPTKGSIRYHDVNLKDFNLKWYRSKIGLVSQEPVLFDTTIGENIKFGYSEASQEEIEAAAKEANAHDFISSFPDGYDTLVGSAGSTQVSGGQKQRIGKC
jgi:ATP-binding cassette subfamily B (MDR/TAP) protein 1